MTYLRSVVLFIGVTLLFGACHTNGYNNNVSYGPFYYSYINYAQGTDPYSGAIYFLITPYGYNTAYEYYEVTVYGLGKYYVPTGGGRVTLPYLYPGNYSFSVHVGCNNAFNATCYDQYYSGNVNVYATQAVQVQFSPN
ncbi:MAG: hypothetical protein JWO58_434 [Chitinophagaceae bacterium]|nr:hypothetical protein [Chitinophagaceae bacterium]